jgi:hypothetical protein
LAELNKVVYNLILDLLGTDGMHYGSYAMTQPDRAMGYDTPQKAFLRMRGNSIEGGNTEVMKTFSAARLRPARRRPGRPRPPLEQYPQNPDSDASLIRRRRRKVVESTRPLRLWPSGDLYLIDGQPRVLTAV